MRILLLRHGRTAGNRERRYVGRRTDEGLDREAKQHLLGLTAEERLAFYRRTGFPSAIYTSPMRRCVETASLLFPPEFSLNGKRMFRTPAAVCGLEECDFGCFEYKNYMELNGDPDYQRFIDSGGQSGFPGGETLKEFRERSVQTFSRLVREELSACEKDGADRLLAFVVHGGTIMAVMEAFAVPEKEYFSWQTDNLSGYTALVCPEKNSFFLTDVAKTAVL